VRQADRLRHRKRLEPVGFWCSKQHGQRASRLAILQYLLLVQLKYEAFDDYDKGHRLDHFVRDVEGRLHLEGDGAEELGLVACWCALCDWSATEVDRRHVIEEREERQLRQPPPMDVQYQLPPHVRGDSEEEIGLWHCVLQCAEQGKVSLQLMALGMLHAIALAEARHFF